MVDGVRYSSWLGEASRCSTHPKPRHHLHESVRKDHPVLQAIESRHSSRRSIRGRHKRAPAVVDKDRESTVQCKPTPGDADPDIPVHGQGLGDVHREVFEDLEILRGKIAISQGSDVWESFVKGFVVGKSGEEEEIEQGFGEEEHGTEDEGGLRET